MNDAYSYDQSNSNVVYHQGLATERFICSAVDNEAAHLIAKSLNVLTSCSCLEGLKPDEPFFVLRGQDISSPGVVLEWMKRNVESISKTKMYDAFHVVLEMRNYKHTKAAD